jgi:xanthine dehydrogenase/oxidase
LFVFCNKQKKIFSPSLSRFALQCNDIGLISILPVSSVSSTNNGATGGSVTSELCVSATISACQSILALLAPFRSAHSSATWPQLCASAVGAGVDLRATGRTDLSAPASGGPDTYQTYGVCIAEVFLDVLTGENSILRCDILMDLGISMNPLLDVGQIEGAFLMGVGLNTLEEVVYNSDGSLFTNDTWEYKIPVTRKTEKKNFVFYVISFK